MNNYACAILPTPILNTPHFSEVFRYPLPLDSKKLLRAVEAVALPGTKFQIREELDQICKVTTSEYLGSELYVDRRFIKVIDETSPERERLPSSPDVILDRMQRCLGLPYIWGGNWSKGVQELLTYYPPEQTLDSFSQNVWTLKGVDCSGLLYEATQGYTPRNTSQLVRYGQSVPISGLNISEIAAKLRPLDLIVWSGHVVIVEDQETTIESRHPFGVVRATLKVRLAEILQERIPVDDWDATLGMRFVVRRWL